MSELMKWMYHHYIKSYIKSQSKDDGDTFRASLFWNSLDKGQRQDAQAVLQFYAVQGFRLGVKTGLALGKELES